MLAIRITKAYNDSRDKEPSMEEAVPITFSAIEPANKAAEAINEAFKRGKYVGHIAVSGDRSGYAGPDHMGGIVLIIELYKQSSAS